MKSSLNDTNVGINNNSSSSSKHRVSNFFKTQGNSRGTVSIKRSSIGRGAPLSGQRGRTNDFSVPQPINLPSEAHLIKDKTSHENSVNNNSSTQTNDEQQHNQQQQSLNAWTNSREMLAEISGKSSSSTLLNADSFPSLDKDASKQKKRKSKAQSTKQQPQQQQEESRDIQQNKSITSSNNSSNDKKQSNLTTGWAAINSDDEDDTYFDPMLEEMLKQQQVQEKTSKSHPGNEKEANVQENSKKVTILKKPQNEAQNSPLSEGSSTPTANNNAPSKASDSRSLSARSTPQPKLTLDSIEQQKIYMEKLAEQAREKKRLEEERRLEEQRRNAEERLRKLEEKKQAEKAKEATIDSSQQQNQDQKQEEKNAEKKQQKTAEQKQEQEMLSSDKKPFRGKHQLNRSTERRYRNNNDDLDWKSKSISKTDFDAFCGAFRKYKGAKADPKELDAGKYRQGSSSRSRSQDSSHLEHDRNPPVRPDDKGSGKSYESRKEPTNIDANESTSAEQMASKSTSDKKQQPDTDSSGLSENKSFKKYEKKRIFHQQRGRTRRYQIVTEDMIDSLDNDKDEQKDIVKKVNEEKQSAPEASSSASKSTHESKSTKNEESTADKTIPSHPAKTKNQSEVEIKEKKSSIQEKNLATHTNTSNDQKEGASSTKTTKHTTNEKLGDEKPEEKEESSITKNRDVTDKKQSMEESSTLDVTGLKNFKPLRKYTFGALDFDNEEEAEHHPVQAKVQSNEQLGSTHRQQQHPIQEGADRESMSEHGTKSPKSRLSPVAPSVATRYTPSPPAAGTHMMHPPLPGGYPLPPSHYMAPPYPAPHGMQYIIYPIYHPLPNTIPPVHGDLIAQEGYPQMMGPLQHGDLSHIAPHIHHSPHYTHPPHRPKGMQQPIEHAREERRKRSDSREKINSDKYHYRQEQQSEYDKVTDKSTTADNTRHNDSTPTADERTQEFSKHQSNTPNRGKDRSGGYRGKRGGSRSKKTYVPVQSS
jgi:hypothetical protein